MTRRRCIAPSVSSITEHRTQSARLRQRSVALKPPRSCLAREGERLGGNPPRSWKGRQGGAGHDDLITTALCSRPSGSTRFAALDACCSIPSVPRASSVLLHRKVRQEAAGDSAVPVVLAGVEEHAVAGPDDVDRPAVASSAPQRSPSRAAIRAGSRTSMQPDVRRLSAGVALRARQACAPSA